MRAIGLSASVTCHAVASESQSATAATVPLTLRASASGDTGPFRIVGTSRGKMPATRTAKAPVPAMAASIQELWVAVGAKIQ